MKKLIMIFIFLFNMSVLCYAYDYTSLKNYLNKTVELHYWITNFEDTKQLGDSYISATINSLSKVGNIETLCYSINSERSNCINIKNINGIKEIKK